MIKIKRFLEYRKCIKCNKEYLAFDTTKINDKDYICRRCSEVNGYSQRNVIEKGKITQASFSFEFETSQSKEELFELIKYGFIGCYDCSIGGREWKSPIFYNKKSFHSVCNKMDKFSKYVGNDCGTHLHVGTKYKYKLQQYRTAIFKPILEYMYGNDEKTRKFWGRYFNHYCSANIEQNSRYCAFNVWSSVETLEFRLLKFVSAKQYIKATDFCIDTTKYINYRLSKDNFGAEEAKKLGENILEKYKEVTASV